MEKTRYLKIRSEEIDGKIRADIVELKSKNNNTETNKKEGLLGYKAVELIEENPTYNQHKQEDNSILLNHLNREQEERILDSFEVL